MQGGRRSEIFLFLQEKGIEPQYFCSYTPQGWRKEKSSLATLDKFDSIPPNWYASSLPFLVLSYSYSMLFD